MPLNNMLIKILKFGMVSIFALIPLHAFLTVWLASSFGHYELIRLWKEILLLPLALIGLYVLFRDAKLRATLLNDKLFLLTLFFLVFTISAAAVTLFVTSIEVKAIGYSLIIFGRMCLFFLLCALLFSLNKVKDLSLFLIIPLTVVILFGLLQLLISPNFLQHFGYGSETLLPYQTVDNNQDFVRIQSTTRGPNPLGAYIVLALPISAILIFNKNRKLALIFTVLSMVILFFTYSRSAYIGMGIVICTFLFLRFKKTINKKNSFIVLGLLSVIFGSIIIFRDNDFIQNVVFHSSEDSSSTSSSNERRLSAITSGVKDIIESPFGSGLGSAGPASVYSGRDARIAENFFIQIGQELGVVGLALSAYILFLLIRSLGKTLGNTYIIAITASVIGVIVINLFSHAFADDTMAYIFTGITAYAVYGIGSNDSIYKRKRVGHEKTN